MALASCQTEPAPTSDTATMVFRLTPHDEPARTTTADQGGQIAISPDGMTVVYPGGVGKLSMRRLAEVDSRLLVEHWGARDAFFSPDSQWVAFFAGIQLRRQRVSGGDALTLIRRLPGHAKGGCWIGDSILYSPESNAGLWRVPADGGTPEQITTPDASRGELSHRWPHALPGGRGVLFTIKTRDINSFNEAKVAVLDTVTNTWKVLIEGGSFARYSPTGDLVWARDGKLFAAPFDLESMTVRAEEAVVVVDGVRTQNESGAAMYDFAANGTLVYMLGGATEVRQELVWVDRDNEFRPAYHENHAFFGDMVMSPDGTRVAIPCAGANDAIMVYDVEERDLLRVEFDGNCASPTWSTKGRELWFLSDRGGASKLYAKAMNTSEPARKVYEGEAVSGGLGPRLDLSPDGKWLAVARDGEIVAVEIGGASRAKALAATSEVDGIRPAFSPDGKHVAYVGEANGSRGIFIRAFDGAGKSHLVARRSSEGPSAQPAWSADGKTLFYLMSDSIFEVSITTEPEVLVGAPREILGVDNATGFCPHPDGKRFLVCRRLPQQTEWEVRVVLNWTPHSSPLATSTDR